MSQRERPYSPGPAKYAEQSRCLNIYGILILEAHADRALPLLKPLREACVRCNGEGLLATSVHIRECPTCEGAGGVWIVDDATIANTVNFLMTTYPTVYRMSNRRKYDIVGKRPYEPPPEETS